MTRTVSSFPLAGALLATFGLLLTACTDASPPTEPSAEADVRAETSRAQAAGAQLPEVAREVLALRGAVFADLDESTDELVFGVESRGVIPDVRGVAARFGLDRDEYRVQVTEPIRFMQTLREEHRPTMGGLQIHFGNFLCTLGFSVDHAGGRSFITNSHCTDNQGSTGSTEYFQPLSSVAPDPIAIEADDPSYFRGGECPRGRQCRYSDASRALYQPGIESLGEIAKTSGANNGDLEVDGTFNISNQDDNSTTFSGIINKVGRTTGWTSGNATNTCVHVNVSGTNITLLCQTLVEGDGQIVGSGDSGSPVFTGTSNVTLVGILWGGSSSGDLFVFSPLKNIQDELGSMDATGSGTGEDDGDNGDGGDDGGDDDDDGGPNCPPNSNAPHCS